MRGGFISGINPNDRLGLGNIQMIAVGTHGMGLFFFVWVEVGEGEGLARCLRAVLELT